MSPITPSSGNSLHSDSPLVSAVDPSGSLSASPPRRPTMSRSNFSLMARTTDAVPSASSTVFSTYTTRSLSLCLAQNSCSSSSSRASSCPPIPTQFRSLNRTTVSDMVPASGIRAAYASASRSSAPPRKLLAAVAHADPDARPWSTRMATEQGAYCSTLRLMDRMALFAVLRAPSEDLWNGSRMRLAFRLCASEHTSWCIELKGACATYGLTVTAPGAACCSK
ncbi:hypothetical protein SORBI_3008G008701 [Sorghum bicolor]|uniref:Uncharacterized protein n=1 Tax=Sorghum bicolor TaxID=4558 RepID=A0A1Z5R586_SORBI|nr:hypothetical protein SORBI_3008G008701 [Sorghum bicolor]